MEASAMRKLSLVDCLEIMRAAIFTIMRESLV